MTELILTTAVPATSLAEHLATLGSAASPEPSPEMLPYLGALTPQRLDAPETETGALLSGAAAHDLGWLRRIAVRGEDRFRWLSGMVTNEVETLPDQSGAYNLVLNAQGRIQGDVYVWRESDQLELEITAEQSEALLNHLDRFIIMDDVELVPLTGQSALGLTGPQAGIALNNLGLAELPDGLSSTSGTVAGIPIRLYRSYGTIVPHYALWTAVEQIPALWQALLDAGATPVGATSLETLRVAEGIPAYGIDIESRYLAQETAQTRALNFTKGCYLGQEIVERIRSRGQVHRHLRALELTPDGPPEQPAVGTELRITGSPEDSKPAGTLTSVATLQLGGTQRIYGIAMIRAEAEIGSQPLTWQLPNSRGTACILHTTPKLT
jgi:folate-binding protein YgfZ